MTSAGDPPPPGGGCRTQSGPREGGLAQETEGPGEGQEGLGSMVALKPDRELGLKAHSTQKRSALTGLEAHITDLVHPCASFVPVLMH
jgi:hypothetical protein